MDGRVMAHRSTQEGRKTPPYVISYRGSNRVKLWKTGGSWRWKVVLWHTGAHSSTQEGRKTPPYVIFRQ
jgi:uncharacterized protein YfaP (DUF2135 family)